MEDKVVQIGIPVSLNTSNESKGVEVKTSAPETPVKETETAKNTRKRK